MTNQRNPMGAVDVHDYSPYFDTHQAAAYLKISARTLERLRLVGGGPVFAKAGRRVIYRKDWLDAWMEARRFSSTADARANGTARSALSREPAA
jgi:hypothetical protein